MGHRYHVVIIGGGFSGTALAIHLIRRGKRPLRLTLVEAQERLGRGIAYSSNVDEHVLNTRAGDGLQQAGKLTVSAGHVRRAFATGNAIFVDREIRGRTRHDRFDWIINCTSPSFRMHESALHGQLIVDGLLTPDRFGLGYVTAGDGAAIGTNGRVEGLYLLGPACKARCWEQTAVPELREQAERRAAEILAVQSRRQRPLLARLASCL